MASTDAGHAGFSSVTNPQRLTRALWLAAVAVAVCYGVFLVFTALRLPSGAELTGQFVAAARSQGAHPPCCWPPPRPPTRSARERRWLIGALVGVLAAGDFLLAMPWWEPSFVLGLAAFLVAHLCFLAALLPLGSSSAPRLTAAALVVARCASRCWSGSGPIWSPKA